MKERQRWQPGEDAILKAYVKQYGPKEWNLISQRMPNHPLHRDPKSCLERWKNYLKPGIKKGSLTPEEQSLVISLQAKYGNKWKKIASELPGRTAKRLGKWWEVFKEKQLKKNQSQPKLRHQEHNSNILLLPAAASPEKVAKGRYDHILDTFAEKYVQPKLVSGTAGSSLNLDPTVIMPDPEPVLSLGLWMNNHSSTSSSLSSSTSSSASPSEAGVVVDAVDMAAGQQVGALMQYCKEVEESRQSWMQQKKEATWRLSRLEQQVESEKARKRREKIEEIEGKIRCLREEEMDYMGRIENEYREQLCALQKDADTKESKLVEALWNNHFKLVKLVEQLGGFSLPVPTDIR